jgi:hypothetical protein
VSPGDVRKAAEAGAKAQAPRLAAALNGKLNRITWTVTVKGGDLVIRASVGGKLVGEARANAAKVKEGIVELKDRTGLLGADALPWLVSRLA